MSDPTAPWQELVKQPFSQLREAAVFFLAQDVPEAHQSKLHALHKEEARVSARFNSNTEPRKKVVKAVAGFHHEIIETKRMRSDMSLAKARAEADVPTPLSFPKEAETYEDLISLLSYALHDAAKQCHARAMGYEHDAIQLEERPTKRVDEITQLTKRAMHYYHAAVKLQEAYNKWVRVEGAFSQLVEQPLLPKEHKETLLANIKGIKDLSRETSEAIEYYTHTLSKRASKTPHDDVKSFMHGRIESYKLLDDAQKDMVLRCADIMDQANSIQSRFVKQ